MLRHTINVDIDYDRRVFRENKYGICFDIKQKNTLTTSIKSDMYTKSHPVA